MKKYLVFINFEYVDAPDEFDDTTRFKNILVGTYDNQQDAKICGNKQLQLFESKFSLKQTAIAETFPYNYEIDDEYNICINHYLIMPFNCDIQIKTVYCDNIENTINEVFESLTNYNIYKYNEDE